MGAVVSDARRRLSGGLRAARVTFTPAEHPVLARRRSPFATYTDGATSFWSVDGTLVMTIPDAAGRQASEDQAARYETAVTDVVFIEMDDQWFEAELPNLGVATPDGRLDRSRTEP